MVVHAPAALRGSERQTNREIRTLASARLASLAGRARDPWRALVARLNYRCPAGQPIVSRNALSSVASTSCGKPWSRARSAPTGRSNVR